MELQQLKILFNRLKEEKGFSMVITSIMLVSLLGFSALVIDVGQLVFTRQKLVTAADAAALAGAGDLLVNGSEYDSRIIASNTAVQNSADENDLEVSISGSTVTVEAGKIVDFTFARVLGFTSTRVSAQASAVAGPLTSYKGIAPMTIKQRDFTYGEYSTLKFGDSSINPGNFGALALGGTGANNYRYNLVNGYQEYVFANDTAKLETEPGNMAQPTNDINDRLSQCTDGCTYDNFKPGCPLVLVIPLHNEDVLQGRDTLTVTGFACFFVDRERTKKKDEINGYFVKMAGEGDVGSSTAPVKGAYGIKLIN